MIEQKPENMKYIVYLKCFFYLWRAPNDDYTPANLQTVTDNLYLNLFDQVLIDIQEVSKKNNKNSIAFSCQ